MLTDSYLTGTSDQKALDSKHIINGRLLDVKVATPKKDMKPSKKITRIFVARLSSKVVEEEFRRYFDQFGTITDLYMPKDSGAKGHRGIGFITFENPEAVEKIMSQSHELGGQTLAIDQATPKDDLPRHSDKGSNLEKHSHSTGPYGAYSPYITASASQLGLYGMSSYGSYDYPGRGPSSDYPSSSLSSAYGVNSWSMGTNGLAGPYGSSGYGPSDHFPGSASKSQGNKVFVGKLPSEATTDEWRSYSGTGYDSSALDGGAFGGSRSSRMENRYQPY